MVIHKCSNSECKNEYLDKKYGKMKRVYNERRTPAVHSKGKGSCKGYRCANCGKEATQGEVEK